MSRSKSILSLLAGAAVALAMAAPVSAAGAVKTTITIEIGPGGEAFTTTGGALCPSGVATTDGFRFGGGGAAGTFHGYKTLVCDDGSGSFTISFNAGTVFGSPQDQGGWRVIEGTGSYVNLVGGGNLVGTYPSSGPLQIVDVYAGRVTR